MGSASVAKKFRASSLFADFTLFVVFWGGIILYSRYADDTWNRLFLNPDISKAEVLEAQGRLPEALDLLLAKAKDNPQNPKLLWALGDYYTKADSPLLAHFYFQMLTHIDENNIDPNRVAFAQPWQGDDTEAQRSIQSKVDETRARHLNGRFPTVFPISVNGMLNEPAANLDIMAGYFDPDYPIPRTCSDGSRCQGGFGFSTGNLWQAIATQHLAINEPVGGKNCCSLALDDPDLRSLNTLESEFLEKLEASGGNYAPDTDAGGAAQLAFRARVLAKQRYVLGFLESASAEAPRPNSWSDLWTKSALIPWFALLLMLRAIMEGRIARRKDAAAAKGGRQSATPSAQSPGNNAENALRSVPLWRRVAYFILATLLLIQGADLLASSTQTLFMSPNSLFGSGDTVITPSLTAAEDLSNGMNFAAGLSLVLVGLLAANRGSRRFREAPGLVDKFLGSLGGKLPWQIIAAAGSLAAFATFGSLYFGHTVVHWSTNDAVSAFRTKVGPLDIFVNGDWVYGISPDGATTHIAAFSPALYRALDQANVEIGEFKYPVQLPVPGILPILTLLVLCAAALWRWRRATDGANAPALWTARCFIAFGLLQLYVVFWLLSAQQGVEIATGDIRPEWIEGAAFLVVSQLVLIASIYDRLKAGLLPAQQLWGWIGLYSATSLAMLPWAYYFSDASRRGPALLWICFYLGLAAMLWWLLMAQRQAAKAT
jgi:tetratricopeptide (TPR) repeat protein